MNQVGGRLNGLDDPHQFFIQSDLGFQFGPQLRIPLCDLHGFEDPFFERSTRAKAGQIPMGGF